MTMGPHIYDNALAEMEAEVFDEVGMVTITQADTTTPSPKFGIALEGTNGNVMMVRCGFLPNGQPYVRFTAMKAATGEPVKVHALETETGAWVETD